MEILDSWKNYEVEKSNALTYTNFRSFSGELEAPQSFESAKKKVLVT